MNPKYIVASSKYWHKPTFDQVASKKTGEWFYAANNQEIHELLETVKPRFIFFLHWNWLVPKEIWDTFECICFHMTDVPYGRGGSPLQNLILAGKKDTKVTALRMVEEMDAGPVYLKYPMHLEGSAEEIYLRAGDICWQMIEEIIEKEPKPEDQKGEVVKFKRRTPGQSLLPKKGSLSDLYDFVRMLDAPTYPLAFLDYGNFRLEFLNAHLKSGKILAEVIIKPILEDNTDE